MNVRTYTNTKNEYCFFITNSAKDRFRVSTNITNLDEAEKKRKEIENALPLSKKQVKFLLLGKQEYKDTTNTFDTLIFDFMKKSEIECAWEYSTLKHFMSLRKRMNRLFPDIKVQEMDEDWLYTYISIRQKTSINTTIQKEVKSIKQVMRYVQKKGVCDCNSILSATPKFKKSSMPNVVFLSKSELIKLSKATMPNDYLEKTRDLFLFGCFTGMRFSDVQKFRLSNIDGDKIRFTTKKTNDTLTIPINSVVMSIINKYDGCLPKMTNQVMNRFVKQMCRVAKIDAPTTEIHYRGSQRIEETKPKWEFITSHSARKTFVSNALMLGVPTSVVMSMTGHHSFQSLQAYVSVADQAKREATKMMESIFS